MNVKAISATKATVDNNVFAGAGYSHNQAPNNIAVIASDSGRSDRTDLKNVRILNNTLNGEIIKGCELPDTVVDCTP